MVEQDNGKELGAADHYTQAYNFRYYVTTDSDRKIAINPPVDYDPFDFELVGRYIEYLKENTTNQSDLERKLSGIFPGWLNSIFMGCRHSQA